MAQTQLHSLAEQMHSYNKSKSVLGEGLAMPPKKGSSSTNPFPIAPDHPPSPHHLSLFPRVEFSPFNGGNPRAWIRYTQRYFHVITNIPEEHKVTLASIHLEGKAEMWFQSYMEGKDTITWSQFLLALLERKLLTAAEMRARTEQNLCYNCDDVFVPSHRYLNTLRIQGLFKHSAVQILIDIGNTHCFLDEDVAIKLGCSVEYTNRMLISVADGNKIVSRTICPDFSWDIRGSKFTYPRRLIKLGGCDVVLGGDCLRLHSPVESDYHKMRLTICKNGKKLIIKAITDFAKLQIISAKSMGKLLKKGSYGLLGQLFSVQISDIPPPPIDPTISALLTQFQDVFSEPKCLPLSRSIEHQITLIPHTVPKKQFPYRCPYSHKAEIESLIKSMLDEGIIRPSHNLFASPILLVKKKDGGWGLCVDYRYFNSITVKHNFPIPVIDELLDELHGSKFFSKLDLSVATDPQKVQAMLQWLIPKSVKSLRGFLGLTGYYRKFVLNYDTITKTLADLLKNDAFIWTNEALIAFNSLKQAMTTTPVLALPDFTLPFIVEIDASSKGIGDVLMQKGRHIAFLSKAIGVRC
ncbi:hypothetical protein BUALT_Bualt19G0030600 [Buddleja alternifolia]|uniref:Reverse transcriptase/retrotransposon-derived protein RNase H-like domain-containing protein n=1 Tax=Buddleja alternifolia TaxID=168488 RepID=A0AAV6W1J8_9LAMI|nr:hypothetical protein BUALT_Bualt19G0030600 [Buddleja alternifolia]